MNVLYPGPRDFAGDGIHLNSNQPHGGRPALVRRLQSRLIQDGERTYRAYSADELIEIDSLANHGRPGHAY